MGIMATNFSIREEILRRLRFQSREQFRVIAALDVLARSFQPATPYDAAAMDQIVGDSKVIIAKDGKEVEKLIRDKEWSPLDVAALFAMLSAERALASGASHMYRGALSAKGRGYRAVFEHALKRLEVIGRVDHEIAADRRDQLAEAIAEAG